MIILSAMNLSGNLLKMRTEFRQPIDYFLQIGNQEVYLNDLLDKTLVFDYNGVINCIHCGKRTRKSFNQGFCFSCMQTAPEADESVIRPELSKAQFGIAKDMEWSVENDLVDHYVYLSLTNELKVGVTRYHQIPTRWIDQGAVKAIKLAKTPNRHIAGVIENFLKQHLADTTRWQAMLKDEVPGDIDLIAEKKRVGALLHPELQKYLVDDPEVVEIEYPGTFQLEKIKSVTFDSEKRIEGKLVRIKGQYLIFENETVMNIRKHNGYFVNFSVIE